MKLIEAYQPAEVRAAGRMVKAIIAAGGKAEDILGYAAYAEKHGANPIFAKTKLAFPIVENTLTAVEALGAFGYPTIKMWYKIAKHLFNCGINVDNIREYLRKERKKELSSTRYGWVRG